MKKKGMIGYVISKFKSARQMYNIITIYNIRFHVNFEIQVYKKILANSNITSIK